MGGVERDLIGKKGPNIMPMGGGSLKETQGEGVLYEKGVLPRTSRADFS